MTKRLEELLNLASNDDVKVINEFPEETVEVTEKALNALDKIETALPQVRGLESSDQELDELADMAVASYKDLQDLGMQVESRFSSEIFNAASGFLGHAITAKTAKLQKKLKMVELQLKQATLEQKQNSKEKELNAIPLGEGTALDRNELLKSILDKKVNK
jgi:hypothetical protein